MRLVHAQDQIEASLRAARSEAKTAFGDDSVYIEKYITSPHHIEFQILMDSHGNAVHLFERECSVQRRHQKMIEETPSPLMTPELRKTMGETAVAAAKAVDYLGAGTIEFLVDNDLNYYFLEMNTRLQVEHPITERTTGVDLVKQQIKIAMGMPLAFKQEDLKQSGHAIECRINAEQVERNFRPSPGLITEWEPPAGPNIRLDSHCHAGYRVPIHYDSMIGKLIVYGTDRAEARERMSRALERFKVSGVATTIGLQHFLVNQPRFAAGKVNTRLVEEVLPQRVTA